MIGLEPWFWNFTQFFYKDQTRDYIAQVPLPRTEYAIWWTMKCAEVSAFVGGVIVHPIYRFYRLRKLTPETTTNNSKKIIRNLCRKLQGRFLLAGMISGPALSLAYTQFKDWDEKELREECYKIRCNTTGLMVDRHATLFFLLGWYWKRFQGGCDGINLALAYCALYKTVFERYSNPLLVDKFKPDELYKSVKEAEGNQNKLTRFWHDLALEGKSDRDLRPAATTDPKIH